MRVVAHETGTEDHVGEALCHWTQQIIVLARIIFEISVLHDQVITRGQFDPLVDRCSLAHVARLLVEADPHGRVGGHVSFDSLHRAILGTIVHDDHLLADAVPQGHIAHLVEDEMDRPLLVVGGNDDGKCVYGHERRRR